MGKFEDYMELVLEKKPNPNLPEEAPEDDESDSAAINFDAEDDPDDGGIGTGGEDLPVEGEEGVEGPAEAMAPKVNTPQDIELARLAVKALSMDGSRVNPKIYDDFEKKRNSAQILNYIESRVGKVGAVDSIVDTALAQLGDTIDTNALKGKSISDKLAYYNQQTGGYDDTQIDFWTRIILNALKYNGNDYNMTGGDGDSMNSIIERLKQDFNYDTRGMFDKLVKDRVTGSSLSGPGVF